MIVSTFIRALCVATWVFAASASASADPPGRVGRITYIEGAVSFHGDREHGWQKARINYPVTTENSLWTQASARAEVRVGPSAFRVDNDSVLDFVVLQDDLTEAYLQRGTVNVRLRSSGAPEGNDLVRIDTPDGRFTLESNGRYRVESGVESGIETGAEYQRGGNETRIAVFSGRARFEGANGADTRLTIDAGKQFSIRARGATTDFHFETLTESSFDRWADSRDRQWDQTHRRYARADVREGAISPYMTGYEDLDANGEWLENREYGRLWAPRVVLAGWAPYRYGRWSYVQPWGWTWIDDAPWGFAPFHYGRWVQVRSRWCWWPGTYAGRPVYAPALVAWFGGAGAGFSIAGGPAVGWFPLAPRENFIPRYTTNIQYLRRVNHVHNDRSPIIAPPRYRNHLPGATVVNNQAFINGLAVGANRANLPPQIIAGHAPGALADSLRPPRVGRPPTLDRSADGQPGNAAPGPRFRGDAPPTQAPSLSPTPAPPPVTLPGANNNRPPRHRPGESGVNAPQPVRVPEPTATPNPTLGPVPLTGNDPGKNPSARMPRSSIQAAPNSPQVPSVDPVPSNREPDARARRESRPPGSPGSRQSRSVPDSPPSPSYAPPALARPPLTQSQPAVTPVNPPAVKPMPEQAGKARHDAPPEPGPGKNEIRDGRGRAGGVRE